MYHILVMSRGRAERRRCHLVIAKNRVLIEVIARVRVSVRRGIVCHLNLILLRQSVYLVYIDVLPRALCNRPIARLREDAMSCLLTRREVDDELATTARLMSSIVARYLAIAFLQ